MGNVVVAVVITIICLQVFFFVKNLMRMFQFKNIFEKEHTWRLRHDDSTQFVNGVEGEGNSIFSGIVQSINKYLGNSTGSVIDYGLLKDAIDRHCDSTENDIATQTPIPLYLGLAGTMAGVIIGLYDMLSSDAILTLMGAHGAAVGSAAESAANGIDALLWGVAWAMVASICGILLTTVNSLLFKRCKLQEEAGKNSFLAWMQSELLPELPSDTSEALNNMVKNLNAFNATFANNTANLGNALQAVNESYDIQAQVIKYIHDMDVMKMAKANVRVLEQLEQCTDKLEQFNEYLIEIQGYTDAIHRFETMFTDQAERLHILEEIRNFFSNYSSSLAKVTTDAHNCMDVAMKDVKDSTAQNVEELNATFLKHSEHFKQIIEDERKAFDSMISEMQIKFSDQLDRMPKLTKHLEEISAIPGQLDKMLVKIEESNKKLTRDIAGAIREGFSYTGGGGVVNPNGLSMPGWMKISGWIALVVIAVACIVNVVLLFFPLNSEENTVNEDAVIEEVMPARVVDTATDKSIRQSDTQTQQVVVPPTVKTDSVDTTKKH